MFVCPTEAQTPRRWKIARNKFASWRWIFGWVKAPGLCRSRDEYPWAASVGTLICYGELIILIAGTLQSTSRLWHSLVHCWVGTPHLSFYLDFRRVCAFRFFNDVSVLIFHWHLIKMRRIITNYCLLMISYWFLCSWLSHPREVSPTRSSSDASWSFTTNSMKRCSRFGPKSSLLDSNCASGGAGVSLVGGSPGVLKPTYDGATKLFKHIILVGGLEHEFYDFPYVGNVIIPTGGRYTTNQY